MGIHMAWILLLNDSLSYAGCFTSFDSSAVDLVKSIIWQTLTIQCEFSQAARNSNSLVWFALSCTHYDKVLL